MLGAIFKGMQADDSDVERRELERMVAEAASGKSKYQRVRAQAKASAHQKGPVKSGSPQLPSPDPSDS